MIPMILVLLLEQPVVYPLENIEVKDGDTIQADIILPFDITLRNQTIRAADYDSPEISRHRQKVEISDEEIKQGMLAKRFLADKLLIGKLYIAQYKRNRDIYGRILGILYYEYQGHRELVSKVMIENNHTRKVNK